MSERGTLRIVVEGEDAQRFHDGLMDFIAKSKENPDYIINDIPGEVYWKIGTCDGCYKADEAICIDSYDYDDKYVGSVVILWDTYENKDALVRLTAEWFNTIEVASLGYLWVEDEGRYFFEFQLSGWGIGTNDAEGKYFKKIIEVIEYDLDDVPDDWAKDWDNLSFDERIALCDKYNVIYIATRIL